MPDQTSQALNWDDLKIFLAVARTGTLRGRRQHSGQPHHADPAPYLDGGRDRQPVV